MQQEAMRSPVIRTAAERGAAAVRQMRRGLNYIRYRPETLAPGEWRNAYESGRFDYFAQLIELPRYSLLAGYIRVLGNEATVLDLGCGPALLRAQVDGVPFRSYLGVDPTETAIEGAQRFADERTAFVIGDAFLATLVPASFDIVVCNEVLSVIEDPPATILRIAELLRPGGHLLSCTWRHPGDRQIFAMIGKAFELVDTVDARNGQNPVARQGWRVMCHRVKPLQAGAPARAPVL